ncbi:MAG: pyruvate kinase, partial [Deltaproteobacteria bacterium]|nr:pyruvate kinase [Deltaproteobacteria bacterium]
DMAMIRSTAAKLKRVVPILVDLPGPKIRVGTLKNPPVMLERGEKVTLTTKNIEGQDGLIPISYNRLADSVHPGSVVYLNDGFIELEVLEVRDCEVLCRVVTGGPLLSRKGLNLPGADIFVDTPTKHDFQLMELALNEGIDIFGISFVESAETIERAREFARKKGKDIYTVAKIERARAVDNIDEILAVTDAIMVARGDLGVEVPIEEVPVLQKEIIRKANMASRPVITATQMLLSMVDNRRPTRAEAADVANAILDGTDAVMLSEETAIGAYPVETVDIMARIAIVMETKRRGIRSSTFLRNQLYRDLHAGKITVSDMISLNVSETVRSLETKFVVIPTEVGSTVRRVSRFKPEGWVIACNSNENTCNFLYFSYGVYPVVMETKTSGWFEKLLYYMNKSNLVRKGDTIVLTEGRFAKEAGSTDSLAIITV